MESADSRGPALSRAAADPALAAQAAELLTAWCGTAEALLAETQSPHGEARPPHTRQQGMLLALCMCSCHFLPRVRKRCVSVHKKQGCKDCAFQTRKIDWASCVKHTARRAASQLYKCAPIICQRLCAQEL